MIQEINVFQIFPRFLLEDPDGKALALALKAGMEYFLQKCGDGLKCLLDVDEMPEWRLDEMAGELNCLYDYGAEAEVKREWIRNAMKHARIHGTAKGIEDYIKYYFGGATVIEWFNDNSMDPGEFDVTVPATESTENILWIQKAAAKAKNVRSALRNISFNGGETGIILLANSAIAGIILSTWAECMDEPFPPRPGENDTPPGL